MKDLISVIIPVYNVEEYLAECIESIIKQTYTNLDIILVDDGSKDSSGKICDEYAKKDKRVTVIHKENAGVSKARNVGLDIAKGEYITFLDSDDFFFETAIESLHDMCIKNDSDISVGGVTDIKDGEQVIKSAGVKVTLNKEGIIKYFLEEKYFKCVIWAKLYKRETISSERFDENLTIAEDFDFLYRILKRANKVYVDTTNMTNCYRIRSGSLMRQKYNKKFENEIDLSEKVLLDVKTNFPSLINTAIRRYQRVIVSCIDKYFRENESIVGVEYLLQRLKKYPNKLDLFQRMKLFMLLRCKTIIKLVYKKIGKM